MSDGVPSAGQYEMGPRNGGRSLPACAISIRYEVCAAGLYDRGKGFPTDPDWLPGEESLP
jgi:hypothetical protein